MPQLPPPERLAPHGDVPTQRTIHCPSGPSTGNMKCIKFRNQDPAATWDFSLMFLSQTVGDSSQITAFIPFRGGGYRRMITRTNVREVLKIDSLEKYESESLQFGFVRLDKMKVRKFYREIRESLFISRGSCQDFDDGHRPVGDVTPIEEVVWPDLPGDEEISNHLRSLRRFLSGGILPGRQEPLIEFSLGVFFPSFEAGSNGEWEVRDGEVFVGRYREAERQQGPDGIRIETSGQEGIPALVTHDYFLQENGTERRLYGDRCAEDAFRQVIETYQDHSENGFFRSKKRLKIVRTELRINTFIWSDT